MKTYTICKLCIIVVASFPFISALLNGYRLPKSLASFRLTSLALNMRRGKNNGHHSSSQGTLKKSGPTKASHKNSYAPVGYSRGDMETCKQMFDSNAVSGQLSYDQFVESRYLRFWPGTITEAKTVWNEIIGSCEMCCTFQEMIEIHQVLDQISFSVENEMENERLLWDIEDLNYENMIDYFHDCVQDTPNNLLSFQKFLDWEFIKAELWFHDSKGLTNRKLGEMWCKYVGHTSNGMDFDKFGELYNEVCDYRYEV